MPRKHSALSLMDCCYRKIAKTADSYWLKDLDNLHDIPRLLYVIGPFENLTNKMVQNLLGALTLTSCLKRKHFSCVLQESVVHLDLSGAGSPANHDSVLQTVKNRCLKLTALNLEGLNSISARCLIDFIEHRGQMLKALNLKRTNCGDQVLSVIGHTCMNLLDLDISETKSSNSGAFSLCQACKPDIGCKKLLKLQIFATMIKLDGALHCLKNLPVLQYLGFDDVCSVIERALTEGQTYEPGTYQLKNLIANGLKVANVSQDSIVMSCQTCPGVTEARLYCGLQDSNLSALTSLKYLTSLGIGNATYTGEMTFVDGILPVLKVLGHQLFDLTLADVNDFDLVSIGKHCKQLRKLTILLSEQGQIPLPLSNMFNAQEQDKMFQNLTHLNIGHPIGEDHFQKDAFIRLLKNSSKLISLTIQYMQCMSTEVLLDVLTHNPMQYLRTFKLVSCDNVGPELIDRLLEGDNDLGELGLEHCKYITRQDFDKFQRTARQKYYDIKMKWA